MRCDFITSGASGTNISGKSTALNKRAILACYGEIRRTGDLFPKIKASLVPLIMLAKFHIDDDLAGGHTSTEQHRLNHS